MTQAAIQSVLALTLFLATGCSPVPAPTAPSPSRQEVTVPTGTSAYTPAWPAVVRPARIYDALSNPESGYHGSALYSRYVLYDDRSFALQYSSLRYPFFEYRGTYSETAGHIDFSWEGWSLAGPWGATGTITDDRLEVSYNIVMQLSDFEDGVYVRHR